MTAMEHDAILQLRDVIKDLWAEINELRSDMKAVQMRQASEDGATAARAKWQPIVNIIITSVITLLGTWLLRHIK